MTRFRSIDDWEDSPEPSPAQDDPERYDGPAEDAHLEMAYEDRFATEFDHDPMNDDIWYDGEEG